MSTKITIKCDKFSEKYLERMFRLVYKFEAKIYNKSAMHLDMTEELYSKTNQLCDDMGLNYLLSKCIIYDTLIRNGDYEDMIIKESARKSKGTPGNGSISEEDFMKFLLKQRLYVIKKVDSGSTQRVVELRGIFDAMDYNMDNINVPDLIVPQPPVVVAPVPQPPVVVAPVPQPPVVVAPVPQPPVVVGGYGFSGLNENQINNILKLTSAFENSTTDLQYGYCENIGDGRGVTFGFVGFCSGTFDGTMLLKEYERLRPNNILSKYIPAFEAIDKKNRSGMSGDVTGLGGLVNDIKSLGSDSIFIQAQINIARKLYIDPSQKKVSESGFKFALTKGQMYDAYINHGEDGALSIIKSVRVSTSDEKAWLGEFLSKRLAILASDRTWVEAVDRVKVYQKLLSSGKEDLKSPVSFVCYGDSFSL